MVLNILRNIPHDHSLLRGHTPPPLYNQAHPPSHYWLVTHPLLIIFLTPLPTLWHLSLSLIVSKYFNFYKNLLWPYDEGCRGVVVLGVRRDKLKQFSMKYLFRKDKTVYYQVKVLMVNRITRNMLIFGKM